MQGSHSTCGNCGAVLTGPYCAKCGQHAHSSARGLGAVLHDAWHDVTHVDGRLWHTLWLLLREPGRLTRDYFEERRARYLPPVRLYLVLSVLFFGLGLSTAGLKEGRSAAGPSPATAGAGSRSAAEDYHWDPSQGVPCDQFGGASRGLEGALRTACERNNADHWRELPRTLVRNVPKMMFIFLPLMAAVMLLLYWRPRRFYVEHLVFLLHNHSAVYLVFLLLKPLEWLGRLWPTLDTVADLGVAVSLGYLAWYPYAAMRRYYGQGRTLTLLKYLVIATAYAAFLAITLAGTTVISALES